MATSPSDILAALQNGVTAINNLASTMRTLFPPLSGISTTVAAGTGTLAFSSSLASAFGTITTSSGASFRVALYPSS